MLTTFSIDMNNLNMQKSRKVKPSKGPTDQEREVAALLSKSIHDEKWLKEENLMKINFDVEIKGNNTYIRCIYFVKENGETVKAPYTLLVSPRDHKASNTFRKVGAIMWPKISLDSPAEKIISKVHIVLVLLFGVATLIGGFSLFGNGFIPTPIDKAIFWSGLAGALGFYIDNVKRGLYNDRK